MLTIFGRGVEKTISVTLTMKTVDRIDDKSWKSTRVEIKLTGIYPYEKVRSGVDHENLGKISDIRIFHGFSLLLRNRWREKSKSTDLPHDFGVEKTI